MPRFAAPAFAALALTAPPGFAQAAADTPRQVYDHYVDCTSSMLAAHAATRRGGDAAVPDPKFDAMVKTMREKAVAAGAAVSTPPDKVAVQIDQARDRRMKELGQPDPAKAKQARKDVGMTTLSCAFDELGKAIAARKAQQAAAQPK